MEALAKIPVEINITTPNRDSLISHIHHILLSMNGVPYEHNANSEKSYFFKIGRKDCGCEFTYIHPEEVPKSSLFCKHGNQIIRYTDEETLN